MDRDIPGLSRSNIDQYYDQLPEGYELAYRGKTNMTDKARGYLRGYWGNVINEIEAIKNIEEDRKAGHNTDFSQKWAGRYNMRQHQGLGLLLKGKFIKKIRK